MAKVKVEFSLYSYHDYIDLEDYGHEDKKWSDLSEEEQDYITDCIRLDKMISLSFEDLE